jgi:hypothetical protein
LGFGVWDLGFGVWGLGFGVWGLGFRVQGLGFGVQCAAETLSNVRWDPGPGVGFHAVDYEPFIKSQLALRQLT